MGMVRLRKKSWQGKRRSAPNRRGSWSQKKIWPSRSGKRKQAFRNEKKFLSRSALEAPSSCEKSTGMKGQRDKKGGGGHRGGARPLEKGCRKLLKPRVDCS